MLKRSKFVLSMCMVLFILGGIFFIRPSSLQTVKAVDNYIDMKTKYFNYMTGGSSYNVNDADISTKIDILEAQAQSIWDTLDKSISRTYLWSDMPDNSSSGLIILQTREIKRTGL